VVHSGKFDSPGGFTALLLIQSTSVALLSFAFAQAAHAGVPSAQLPPKTTLPIVFTRGIDANHTHVGDTVLARTTQDVILPGGLKVPAGAQVSGHVVEAAPFKFDRTPYARQTQSTLSVHFDTVSSGGRSLPLNVYVRAMADPLTTSGAEMPVANDDSSSPATTQIGGDTTRRSQDEVLSQDGDVVGYRRRGAVYAHLISASGKAPSTCDASDTEESMGAYSASACGLYGFVGDELKETGAGSQPSTLVLASQRQAPKIWKNSTALLEVLPSGAVTAQK